MAHPVADDPAFKLLKEQLEAAEKTAQSTYSDFKKLKDEAETKGLDLSDDKAYNRISEAGKAYQEAADEADRLKDSVLRFLERGGPGGHKGSRSDVSGAWPTDVSDGFVKAIQTEEGQKALVSGSGAGAYVAPFFSERLRELPQRRLFVRSLIPSESIESDYAWFLQETVFTNQAAPVAAGALKPTSTVTVQRQEQPVTTVAHLSEPIDNAILSDEPKLRAFLDGRLRLGVLLAEENQIINGNGTPPNLRGILNTAGILTQARASDPHVDAILKGLQKIRNQDVPYEPTGVVVHPLDWQTIVLTKDAGGDYQANESGAFTAADAGSARGDSLWSLPVIQSRVIAQGTALVGDFTAATIFDREQARVQVSESGGLGAGGVEIFSRNQVVFRGEERLAFGVERPAAFCTVTGL